MIDCGDLLNPEGGQVQFTPGVVATTDTGLGAVATYSCDFRAGYMLYDTGLTPTRTCQDDGRWSGVPATCTRKYNVHPLICSVNIMLLSLILQVAISVHFLLLIMVGLELQLLEVR